MEAVPRIGDGPHVPSGSIVGSYRDLESVHEMPRKALGLHVSKIQSQTHMRAAAERHEGEFVSRARGFRTETQGVVALGVGPNSGMWWV